MSCWWLEPNGNAIATLLRHLPLGPAWQMFRTPGKVAARLYEAYASAYDDCSAALCRLTRELDPRTTTDLIGEWEQALSLPDPCLPSATTIEQRRERLMFRLAKRRWTTARDWQDLAALFGLAITVTPGWVVQKPALYPMTYPRRYDRFPKLGRFRVYINVQRATPYGYDYGLNERGPGYPIPYGAPDDDLTAFKCLIDRIRPANVVVIWDAPLETDPYGICVSQSFSSEFSEEFC